MPRFIQTKSSHFEPFSYEQLVAPITRLQDVHDETQNAYDQLSMDTKALEQYLSSDNDKDIRAKELYNDYLEKLNTLQDNLWTNGVTAQTRRDLSAARASYAGNIVRLQKAIQDRQNRSKEYWDYRHSNPTAIMGEDPGKSDLDSYLNDANFGSNWFSYSGKDFTQEVAADAKSRAKELLNNYNERTDVQKDPRLIGYLTRIVQKGYTGEEVQRAGDAAYKAIINDDYSYLDNLSGAEGILANVLISHINSSGARGKVSNEELSRLFEYGRTGLSGAIGDTDVNVLSDKQWEFAKSLSLSSAKSTGKPGVKTSSTGGGSSYSIDDVSVFLKANNANDITKNIAKHYIDPFKEPIIVSNPNGQTSVIASPKDAEKVIDSLGGSDIKNKFAIDPTNIKEGIYNMPDEIGGTTRIKLVETPVSDFDPSFVFEPYVIQKENEKGKWVKDKALTDEFNRMNKEYQDNYSKFRKDNPGIKLNELIISESDRKALEKAGGISSEYGRISDEDLPYVLSTKAKIGNVTPAVIAGPGEDMESTRKNYAARIIESFARAPKNSKGTVDKNSEVAFYAINGYGIDNKGEGDIAKVFGLKKNGTNEVINPEAVTSISVLPEDLKENRVRATINGKVWGINPSMLGNNMDVQLKALREPVDLMMLPIFNPERALNLSDEEAAQWVVTTSALLGDYISLIDGDPVSGNINAIIRPEDIVRNADMQQRLRAAVTQFMNDVIAEPRDKMNQDNMRVRSNTGVSYYNPQNFEE